MQREHQYEYLYPDEVKKIVQDTPLCYMPFGAMEWHDMHAPLGTDSFIGHGLCLRMAKETGGVVLPAHHWSIHVADTADGPYVWEKAHGSLCINNAELWESEIRTQVNAVIKKGWQVVVLLAGHVGQPERDILEKVASEHQKPGEPQVVYIYPYAYTNGDHAGRYETNILLGLCPDLVRDAPSEGNPWCGETKDQAVLEDGNHQVRDIIIGAVRDIRDALAHSSIYSMDRCPQIVETSSNIKLDGKWIAPQGEKLENYYFLARRQFDAPATPDNVILRVAADSRYAVCINGKFVGNGPVRGTHQRYFFDSYDVSQLLKPGVNWIAAEMHCPVRATYSAAPHAPAFLAEIEGIVATDSSWETMRCPSRRHDAPLYTMQIGFSEWRDMRAEREGWQAGNDDREAWQPAEEVGNPQAFGGRVTNARSILPLTHDVFFPLRAAEYGHVSNAESHIEDPEYALLMSTESHLPADSASFTDMDALKRPGGATTVLPEPSGDAGAFLILDFDREVFGNLEFDIEAPTGTVMDVGHGETLENNRLITQCHDYRFADRFVLREGRQTISQRLHNRGFRYLQIVFRNFRHPIRIHSIRIMNRVYSREPSATFACYDPFLSKLWKSCVNTIRLCSADTFMDCIWREQALWTNDQCVTNLYYLAMTGDATFAAHNLRMGADGALPDGLIPPVYPSGRSTLFSNLPALWTFSVHDYYLYSGDEASLKEFLPVMEKALSVYDTWREEDGLIADQPGMWNFIEWGYGLSGVELAGKTAALNMLIAAAYKQAAYLEHTVGNADRVKEYAGKSCMTLAVVNDRFWDAEKGLYSDCTDPKGDVTFSQHPLAIGLSFDLFDDTQRDIALKNLLRPDLIQAQLYFQHYVLNALAQHGHSEDAMSVIRQRWAMMVEANSHTVWETSEGRKPFGNCGSLCHAFSCAPLYFIQSVILGVKPVKPGFREFSLAPQPCGLGSAKGHIPTPHGPISVQWSAEPDGNMVVNVEIPKGTGAVTKQGQTLEAGMHELILPLE